jgi:hypothetical protein
VCLGWFLLVQSSAPLGNFQNAMPSSKMTNFTFGQCRNVWNTTGHYKHKYNKHGAAPLRRWMRHCTSCKRCDLTNSVRGRNHTRAKSNLVEFYVNRHRVIFNFQMMRCCHHSSRPARPKWRCGGGRSFTAFVALSILLAAIVCLH